MLQELANYQHIAHSLGTLGVGDQITFQVQINHASAFAEVWVGDNRHVSGASPADEVSMHIEMGVTGNGNYYYNLIQDSPGKSSTGNIEDLTGDKGALANWVEVRMTMGKVGGNTTFGLDTATVEARNLSTGTAFSTVGTFPMNTQGIGFGATGSPGDTGPLYLVLGGQSGSTPSRITIFDNITVTPEPGSMLLLLAGGLALLARRRRT